MIRIALTGSIGMGKSATARLFAEEGLPVFDADAVVHRLYAKGGAAVGPVGAAFPGTVKAGAVDRAALSAALARDAQGFARLEAIVHPLVEAERRRFLEQAEAAGAKAVLMDIPLLFEKGLERLADVVVLVSAPEAARRARVLARPGMTEAKLEAILARQTPDSRARACADHVIDTSGGEADARAQIRAVLAAIYERFGYGRD